MKSNTYEEFVEKFKPKLTTDDCFTPPAVYDTVKDWACKEYGISPENIIRPFWPGADYERKDYPAGCVVLDNPPFSILSKICAFYLDRDIKFFLFAPSLTVLSGKDVCMRMNHIICDANIVYENGAVVRTAFVTNLGDGETIIQTAPDLGSAVKETVKKIRKETAGTIPKYEYPDYILTAALMQRYSKYGILFRVKRSDCVRVSKLDAQAKAGKTIFGSGLLLSSKAAAERAAAERAAAEVWKLSAREIEIVNRLDRKFINAQAQAQITLFDGEAST